ncbi:iron chaperone [Streptomyces sp. NPDC087440]|uniref:iron chaperone n=1 Tax=Streptomyces sp. NPDC087440 TaxID=3365790 RepID=UPI0037FB962F
MTSSATSFDGFSEEERAAMKDHARELKAAARRQSQADKDAQAEQDVVAKIAELDGTDRVLADGFHQLLKKIAPELNAKLWYGMPAYCQDGKMVCFFQSAAKFKARYATIGFSDQAALDEGDLWPTTYAVTALTPATESRLTDLVVRALG